MKMIDDAISEGPALWDHQRRALEFIQSRWQDGRPGVMLAMEMGTGKSATAIHAIHSSTSTAALVLCPKSVMSVWPEQVRIHWPGLSAPPVVVLEGPVAKKRRQLEAALNRYPAFIVVCNYESAWREPLGAALTQAKFDLVICDESHRIKAVSGRASRFVGKLGASATYRLGLTGTPTPNGPLDIWAQYRFLDPRIYGPSYTAFRARYTRPSTWSAKDGVIMGQGGALLPYQYANMEEYHRSLGLIAFQVDADVLNLPEAVDSDITFELEPAAAKIYRRLERDFIAEVGDGVVSASNALVKLLRLAQLTGGWLRQDSDGPEQGDLVEVSSAKRDTLRDLLEDIAEPVVVFARFHTDLDAVHQAAASLGRGSLELSGRRNELAEWQSGAAPILAVQPAAGGLGVTMVRARIAIWYSLSYSLAEYLQARARLVRPGQSRSVLFLHLIASGTIDREVRAALAQKADVMDGVLAALRGRA